MAEPPYEPLPDPSVPRPGQLFTGKPMVVREQELSRYEVYVDGVRCGALDYAYDDTGSVRVMVLTHTVTNPAMRGQGLAAHIVRWALDDAVAMHWKVDPQCWYVAQFIERHPEYATLLS